MAIAYDATGTNGSFGTSISYSHTFSGSNRIAVVYIFGNGVTPTSVTVGGVACTSLGGLGGNVIVYYLINPSTGSQTVSATFPFSTQMFVRSISYTGVRQTSPLIGATSTSGSGTLTANITTVFSGSLLIGYGTSNNAAMNAGTGTTRRTGNDAMDGVPNYHASFESSTTKTPQGAYSIQSTFSITLGVVELVDVNAGVGAGALLMSMMAG